MRSHALSSLLVLALAAPLGAVVVGASDAGAANATTSGRESFHGFLLATGGTSGRHIVSSPVAANGVFDGLGRIVEVASRPGDPDNSVRDNLVFPAGTMHLLTVNNDVSFVVDPRTCRFHARLDQTGRVVGGTRTFAHASGRFTSTVKGYGVFLRKADGTCRERVEPRRELDVVTAHGRLTF